MEVMTPPFVPLRQPTVLPAKHSPVSASPCAVNLYPGSPFPDSKTSRLLPSAAVPLKRYAHEPSSNTDWLGHCDNLLQEPGCAAMKAVHLGYIDAADPTRRMTFWLREVKVRRSKRASYGPKRFFTTTPSPETHSGYVIPSTDVSTRREESAAGANTYGSVSHALGYEAFFIAFPVLITPALSPPLYVSNHASSLTPEAPGSKPLTASCDPRSPAKTQNPPARTTFASLCFATESYLSTIQRCQ
mmetsp:Transcript_30144/g.55003  ORF Transcript_30144/g.55003 Transcript_30144/m.55003 type:complete len:244 (+) Transcript_30144:171-902(+)